jgi:DNA-binding transcriptional regulator LsrR (DeoR family)
MSIMDNTKFSLLVCEMFYQRNLSQKEIATELKISRSQVCRILASALKKRLVTINLNYPNSDEGIYQNKIHEKYGVAEVYIYDIGDAIGIEAIKLLADISKNLFPVIIKDKSSIGVMAGRTLCSLANSLSVSKDRGLEFVALCGGTGSNGTDWYANAVVENFAKKTNGKYFILNAPQYVSNIEGKKILTQEPSIKEILELGKTCDSALIGIGNIESDSTTIQASNLLKSDIDKLKSLGAVASICASYLDADGKIIDCEVADRIIGLSIKDLEHTRKICMVEGKSKIEAIKAVLKGGYLDVLITSLSTAKLLI